MLVVEQLAGAAHAGLDLVDDQQQAVLAGQRAQLLQEFVGRGPHAGFALDRLQHDATVLSVISAFTESRSLSFAFGKPGTFGSNSGSNAFLPDADMVASVRPWKPPSKVMISYAPPLCSGHICARA